MLASSPDYRSARAAGMGRALATGLEHDEVTTDLTGLDLRKLATRRGVFAS